MKILFVLAALFTLPLAHAEGFPLSFGDSTGRFRALSEVPPGMTLQRLVNLTSDRDKNINYLNLMLDEHVLVTGLYNEADKNNKPSEGDLGENLFWLRDIESKEGVVLATGRGRKALILMGQLDRATQEGKFTLKYLANGLSMRYESCDFELKREENNGAWWVKNVYTGAKVTALHVETHTLGIKPIKAICKQ